jgi:hypothetical protein
VRGRFALGIILVVAVLAGLGVVSPSLGIVRFHVTFFRTKGQPEPAAEHRYRELIRQDWGTLEPLNAELDICNRGGSIPGCYRASSNMITGLHAILHDLNTTHVPSRYVDGNNALRQALQGLIDGYRTRNKGLAAYDNALFVSGNDELKAANADINSAWGRFPPDARPHP